MKLPTPLEAVAIHKILANNFEWEDIEKHGVEMSEQLWYQFCEEYQKVCKEEAAYERTSTRI